MKELEDLKPDQMQVANIATEKKKMLQMLGSTIMFPGHKVWELNVKTSEIKEAEFTKTDQPADPLNPTANNRRMVIIKESHLYVTALNITSARRKFIKHFNVKINEHIKNRK